MGVLAISSLSTASRVESTGYAILGVAVSIGCVLAIGYRLWRRTPID
jgi:hypothetical protein